MRCLSSHTAFWRHALRSSCAADPRCAAATCASMFFRARRCSHHGHAIVSRGRDEIISPLTLISRQPDAVQASHQLGLAPCGLQITAPSSGRLDVIEAGFASLASLRGSPDVPLPSSPFASAAARSCRPEALDFVPTGRTLLPLLKCLDVAFFAETVPLKAATPRLHHHPEAQRADTLVALLL